MINIILDIGTLNTKAGFAAEASPRIKTESFYISAESQKIENDDQMLFAPQNPLRHFAYNLDLSRKDIQIESIHDIVYQRPEEQLGAQHCKIQPESYCKFVADLLNQLRDGNQAETQVLLVQPSSLMTHELNYNRGILCQYLLEQFNLSSIYFLKSSVANCFSQGAPGGLVIDSGQNFTTIARVVDGYEDYSTTINFGGNILTKQLQKIVQKKELTDNFTYLTFDRSKELTYLVKSRQFKAIKEQLFRESEDIEDERVVTVELPDKQTISIDKGQICEPFTQLNQYQKQSQLTFPLSYKGISRTVVDLLEQSKEKSKISLNKNIIFTGGNFLSKDTLNRSQNAISKSAGVRDLGEVQFVPNKHQLQSAWVGGSIVSTLPLFSSYWLTNREWKESGVSLINKKCP